MLQYTVCIFFNGIRCVAVTPTNANCMSEWIQHTPFNEIALGSTQHPTASTLAECQKACELNPRCVVVDWNSYNKTCWINTNPNHTHYRRGGYWADYGGHYVLVSRCNFSSGQCFYDVLTFYLRL